MDKKSNSSIKRRTFIKTLPAVGAGIAAFPYIHCGNSRPKPMTRSFGRLNHKVTTLGLGGQASLQWTPSDVDPVPIILKAFDLGVNYYDTSNLYGPSQSNYGKAFTQLDMIPGKAGYNESLRRSIFLTSKTHLRMGKGSSSLENVNNWSNGDGTGAVDDLKRSLSQIFGDGEGGYPKGAYLDMILLHSVTSMNDVEAVYTGLYDTDASAEQIGALAALRDYRDGSNLTGLNPKEEKLVRHIGFSGHYSPPVMMELIQRDTENVLDAVLVAVNSNDKFYFNMQNNLLPIASAKNMGIIGMKVFADGAMYSKGAHWSREPKHVVRTVGSSELESAPLVRYALTTPGVHTAIIGIGQISDDPAKCQLQQNYAAAQVAPDGMTEEERAILEQRTKQIKGSKTNYFQREYVPLSAPQNPGAVYHSRQGCSLKWDTAFAGQHPLDHYEIWRNGEKLGEVTTSTAGE
ncbi:MAG: aldo/keto reductase [candidate division KSB1 bacterium]|nr:aldo/keto reductase [candidate division KSB1 bacterium]